jgi:hypothetical protein
MMYSDRTERPSLRSHRKGRARAVTLAVALVAMTLLGAAPASAAPNDPDGPTYEPPETTTPNRPPTAVASFSLKPRAEDSADQWSQVKDSFPMSYVHPTRWSVILDGCGSWGGSDVRGRFVAITSYDWRLEPLDGQQEGVQTGTSAKCAASLTVGTLGRWRATLTVRAANGKVARAAAGERRFRDLVVVALGDSYVSGEGNPDKTSGIASGRWSDRQCHRSKGSWAMRAARRFEDANTAVTFLNFACSGATVDNVLSGYKGMQVFTGDNRLPSQLVAARDALGAPFATGSRPVHTVLMSVGVNDVEFSYILRECASFNAGDGFHMDLPGLGALTDEPCSTAGLTRYVRNGISQLRESYDRLEAGLAANLKARSVRFVEYPSRIMTNGGDNHTGCGALNGISSGEAHWITDRGDELNAAMAAGAARNGWTYVSGIRDAFRRHGYCARTAPWFRSFSASLERQGNKDGTAHPLGTGHSKIGEIVATTIPSEEQALPAPARVRFQFTRVRVSSPPGEGYEIVKGNAPPIRPTFGVLWNGMQGVPADKNRSIPLGQWVQVPEAYRTTTVETYGNTIGVEGSVTLPALKIDTGTAPQAGDKGRRPGKGFIVTGLRRARFFALHRRADGWRQGTQMVRAGCNQCSMELEYTVAELPF